MSEKFIDFTQSERDYAKILLKQNPFPALAIPEEKPSITADRQQARDKFVNVIGNLRKEGESSVVIFIGDYGSGKSHLLRVFATAIGEQLYNIKDGVFPIFLRSPGKNFLEYAIEAFTGVGLSKMTEISHKLVEEYISKNQNRVKSLIHKSHQPKFESGNYVLEDLLEETQVLDLFKEMRAKMLPSVKDEDFLYAFLALSHKSSRMNAWNWFSGSYLSKDEKERIMVSNLNDDSRRAKIFLKDFVDILMKIGFQSIVFLIDEFEKTTLIPSKQRQNFHDDIRDIIDEFPKKVALFFAITPHAWQQIEKEPSALTRRLRSNLVYLTKFDEKDIKELIQKYLAMARTEKDMDKIKDKFPGCKPEFAPFTEEALKEILEESEGLVSDILEKCRMILEFFVDHPSKEITGLIVKSVLKL